MAEKKNTKPKKVEVDTESEYFFKQMSKFDSKLKADYEKKMQEKKKSNKK